MRELRSAVRFREPKQYTKPTLTAGYKLPPAFEAQRVAPAPHMRKCLAFA